MAGTNPTVDPRVVPIDLPTWHLAILRGDLFGGLASTLDDLTTPDRLRDPAATAREGAIFARLLEALDESRISLPDEEARERIERMAESFDKTNDYAPVTATHDAHHALLDVLGGADREPGCVR